MKVTSFNSNQLKIIALIAMLIDNINYINPDILPLSPIIQNNIGFLSFPIIAYLLVEGYCKTKNIKKYVLRLLIFAIISQIPYIIFINDYVYNLSLFTIKKSYLFDFKFNVLFTLLYSLLSLYIIDNIKNKIIKTSILIILIILSIPANWGTYGILVIITIYKIPQAKRAVLGILLSYFIFVIGNSLYNLYFDLQSLKNFINIIQLFLSNIIFFLVHYLWILFTIPLLKLYNGKLGQYNLQYLFYIFYPLQLIIIKLVTY